MLQSKLEVKVNHVMIKGQGHWFRSHLFLWNFSIVKEFVMLTCLLSNILNILHFVEIVNFFLIMFTNYNYCKRFLYSTFFKITDKVCNCKGFFKGQQLLLISLCICVNILSVNTPSLASMTEWFKHSCGLYLDVFHRIEFQAIKISGPTTINCENS